MTDEEFLRIYRFLKSRYGVNMEHKKDVVTGRLENYVKNAGFSDYTAYMDAVELDSTRRLERELVDMLTTHHTFFMREPEHFTYLKREVLPQIYERGSDKRELYIWCGACSTGEEAYTIAMTLSEFFALEYDLWRIKIYATDVSTEALDLAKKGIYTGEKVAQLPNSWKRRYFTHTKDGEYFTVKSELTKSVSFRKLNLMDEIPFGNLIQVVFLRNVMIYFEPDTRKILLKKVYDALAPGGYLFTGASETADVSGLPFEVLSPSIFRKPFGHGA
jgi:chemotaxis protein methyltransferase CheR